jgi:hypothetical protein
MHRFIILIALLSISSLCFAQVSKKTYQTIMTGNAESIKIDIEGAKVDLKETKGTRILVETSVQLSLPNEALLNFVVESGRYELTKSVDATSRQLSLSSKKNKNVIVVKGETCQEKIVYTIYVPNTIKSF